MSEIYHPSISEFADKENNDRKKWEQRIRESQNLVFEITDDIERAREIIDELVKKGVKPTVTIPEQWLEKILQGGIPILSKFDRKTNTTHEVTAARFGGNPYLPSDEIRYVVEINPSGLLIEPRLTGKNSTFCGTVHFPKGIPKENIHLLGKFSKEDWKEYLKREKKEITEEAA